jgi:predicted 3-demethylubiquinone-9 3-methyltransferase (glyoxalase superfamily)
MVVMFELNDTKFMALNGGAQFEFNESISMVLNCEGQEEVDHYWNALTANGGTESQCGWLKDKFGVSWQIVPIELMACIGNADAEIRSYAIQEMLKMKKIEIHKLTK